MLLSPIVRAARDEPDRPAIADGLHSQDYGGVARAACRIAGHLRSLTRREQVMLMLPASTGFVDAFCGILGSAKAAVPLNFLLSPAELAGVVADCDADLLLTCGELASRIPPASLSAARPGVRVRLVEDLLAARPPETPGVETLAADRSEDDLAVLLYTSGTVAEPKGVMLTHGNLRANVLGCIEHLRMRRDHAFGGVIPLFHSFGMTATMLAPLTLGARAVYLPRFSPGGLVGTCRRERISVLMAVPSMYAAALRLADATPEDFASIDLAVAGGEALPMGVYEMFLERFGVPILQGYGMTEASPVVAVNRPWDNRPGSVGRPLPRVEVRLADETGRPLTGNDLEGEILLRGPNVTAGYYNRQSQTREAFGRDGWFRTGDLGRLDEDGFLHIQGRKKDVLKIAGELVWPAEIEEALRSHPGVSEAAVIGMPSKTRGEVPAAFVVPASGRQLDETELRGFCRDRLAGYKVPRKIVFVDSLPRSVSGKILKRALRPPPG